MTVNTNSLHSGNGGIFSDQFETSFISISWSEDESSESESKIKFVLSNSDVSESDGTRITQGLDKAHNYDLEINFNGVVCNVLLNGEVIGDPITCGNGFAMLGSPELCYSDVEGRWIGTITNLKFDGFAGKQQMFTSLIWLSKNINKLTLKINPIIFLIND